MKTAITALAIVLACAVCPAAGQNKPATKATATAAGPATAPPPPPAYTYNPEGRRDPFVSLLRRSSETARKPGKPADGVAGFLVSEIELKGILQSRGSHLALVVGPDAKTYTVHVNDRLLDGSIKAITADTLVLWQDVNDPLSLTKQREVRKVLRAAVDVK